MKSLSPILLALVMSTLQGLSQGRIIFDNQVIVPLNPLSSLDAPIFGLELENPPISDWANAKFGNTATNSPAGTQIYNGSLLSGLTVSFWAAAGTGITDAHLLTQGNLTSTLIDGYFSGVNVTFTGLPTSGQATVQVRVSANGDNLLDFGEGYAAVSPLFIANLSSIGTLASGLRSFDAGWRDGLTLTPFPVPEPTTIAFFGLGGGILFFAKKVRKNRSSRIES